MENNFEKIIKKQLTAYYKTHLIGMGKKVKNPEEKFNQMLEGIDNDILELVLKTFKNKNINFCNSRGFSFNAARLWINIDVSHSDRQESVFHEIGHALDFINIEKIRAQKYNHFVVKNYSNMIELSQGLTLDSVIKQEIKGQANTIYADLKDTLQHEVFDMLPSDLFKRYQELNKLYEEKKTLARSLPRKNIWGYNILEKGMDPLATINWKKHYPRYEEALEAWERLETIKCILGDYKEINSINKSVRLTEAFKRFNENYTIVLDMLNGVKKLEGNLLVHSHSYFKQEGRFGSEFFAEAFAATVCHKNESIELTKKYLPQSLNAFRELLAYIKQTEN